MPKAYKHMQDKQIIFLSVFKIIFGKTVKALIFVYAGPRYEPKKLKYKTYNVLRGTFETISLPF